MTWPYPFVTRLLIFQKFNIIGDLLFLATPLHINLTKMFTLFHLFSIDFCDNRLSLDAVPKSGLCKGGGILKLEVL